MYYFYFIISVIFYWFSKAFFY